MRMWEFDDSRAGATNLVLEQDFILRIRRLHRLGSPFLVANLLLSLIEQDYSGRGPLEDVHRRLQALVVAQKGVYAEMTNGDVFVVWPASRLSNVFPEQLMMVTLPNGVGKGDQEKYIQLFHLPEDYNILRERANAYIDMSRTTSNAEDENAPARLLRSEAARGPLTAWSVDQIEQLVKDIDLCSFIRSQSIYEYQADKSWRQMFDETFIGLEPVKQTYFPHVDIMQPKHLFLGLCHVFDRGLLTVLTQHYDSVADLSLNLNISIQTILGSEFAQFTHRIPRAARAKIGFEVHCGDLFQDFTQTLGALATLRQEGYRVAIDGVTPDMLGYLNLSRFDVDYIKVNVSREQVGALKYPLIRAGISQSPHKKMIFFHCDTEAAIKAGLEMNVTRFQGWLVDDLARQWRKV